MGNYDIKSCILAAKDSSTTTEYTTTNLTNNQSIITMVDTKGMKLQDQNLLSEVKQHNYKLKHVREQDIKQPTTMGLGHVVEKKQSCCSKR